MKTRTQIAVGAAAVVLIGATVWRCWPSREPEYKGTNIREYLSPYHIDNAKGVVTMMPESQVDAAFRSFGTNSVPYVRAALRARDTWPRKALVWTAAKAPWLRPHVEQAMMDHLAGITAYQRILQHGYWGTSGAACETELRALTNEPCIGGPARVVLADIQAKRAEGQFP